MSRRTGFASLPLHGGKAPAWLFARMVRLSRKSSSTSSASSEAARCCGDCRIHIGEWVGPKTLRALALASELVHGTPVSMRDPARFAFAHGGKDGTPFPVDKPTYDKTIE